MNYFSISEIFKNCTQGEVKEVALNKTIWNNILFAHSCLNDVRDQINIPFIVNSWYRNSEHNKIVGGVSTSQHLKGLAIDFRVSFAYLQCTSYFKIAQNILECSPFVDQIIVYPTFIHVSFVKDNPRKQFISKC